MSRHGAARVGRVALVLVGLLLACAGARAADTDEAVRRCVELLPGLSDTGAPPGVEIRGGGFDERTGVRLAWTEPGFAGRPRAGWLVCWFYPRARTSGAWQFIQVESSRFGLLNRYDIQQLYKFLNVQDPDTVPAVARTGWRREALYIVQQGVNAFSLGCVYALVAVAFTLVFGVTRVINLAFGELVMIGAFVMFLMATVLRPLGVTTLTAAALIALPIAAATVAAWGLAMHHVAFRRLRVAPGQVALIVAIGFSIALKEGMRLLQGPRTRWLPFYPDALALGGAEGFTVFVSIGHVLVGVGTGSLAVLLGWCALGTRFGRGMRAIAQDQGAAALMGVDVERGAAAIHVVAAGLAGVAGVFVATQYGLVDPYMGTPLGFKALAAAILGGIGSLPGAIAGAFVIASAETLAAVTVGSAWKETVAFAALTGVLVFRPQGLFGRADTERV